MKLRGLVIPSQKIAEMQPYIKLIKTIGKFDVWRVDGKYIRKYIDEDFTNFGQHYRFNFIPLNELWLDIEASNDESQFFIDHLIMENKLMENGFSYDAAIQVAEQVEKNERYKSNKFKEYINIKNQEEKQVIVKKDFIGDFGQLKIWLVDGELVRDFWYIDFTAGGHDLVYNWIPKQEIWIDDDLEEEEIHFVLLHEYVERNFMFNGDDYSTAHKKALKIELNERQN